MRNGYEDLANAIILQALKDYKGNPYEVERFFNSEWYSVLTNVPSETIIKIARSGVKPSIYNSKGEEA